MRWIFFSVWSLNIWRNKNENLLCSEKVTRFGFFNFSFFHKIYWEQSNCFFFALLFNSNSEFDYDRKQQQLKSSWRLRSTANRKSNKYRLEKKSKHFIQIHADCGVTDKQISWNRIFDFVTTLHIRWCGLIR